jgi:C4-type Zn-finger protein
MENSLSNFTSYLTNIEGELKQLHEKHSKQPEYNEQDVSRLLEILEELNNKMANLDNESNSNKKVTHY